DRARAAARARGRGPRFARDRAGRRIGHGRRGRGAEPGPGGIGPRDRSGAPQRARLARRWEEASMSGPDFRTRREAVVREHMESENRLDFEATLKTFAHTR